MGAGAFRAGARVGPVRAAVGQRPSPDGRRLAKPDGPVPPMVVQVGRLVRPIREGQVTCRVFP